MCSPSGAAVGRSLYEWTAKSISLAISASRSAETKTPTPEPVHRRGGPVAGGDDLDQLDRPAGGRGQRVGDVPGLGQRQGAAPGAEAQRSSVIARLHGPA